MARKEDVPQDVKPIKGRRARRGFNSVEVGVDYTDEELEFMRAIDKYKSLNNRPHPTLCEVLAVAKALGYRRARGTHGG
jgi:hypothetical protein